MLRSNAMQRAVGRAFDRTYDRLERGAIAAARRNNAMLLYVPDVPGAALQFALGAYAIAPAGSPVGRLLDMQYGAPKLGPELLPETKFVDNYTGWTQVLGTVTAGGGRLRTTRGVSVGGRATAPISCVPGRTYRVSAERYLGGTSSAGLVIAVSSTSTVGSVLSNYGVTGPFSAVFVATQSTHWVALDTGTGTEGQYCEYASVSVRELIDAPSSRGPDLVSNGDFALWSSDNPVNWGLSFVETATEYVTQGSPGARLVSTTGNFNEIAQNIGLVNGKTYEAIVQVSACTGQGALSNASSSPVSFTAPGCYRSIFTAVGGSVGFKRSSGGVASDFTVTSVSVKEVFGFHCVQSTASSKPTVVRIPRRKGPDLVANGGFDSSAGWTTVSATIASGVLPLANQFAYAQQDVAVRNGAYYELAYTVTATSGAFPLALSGTGFTGTTTVLSAVLGRNTAIVQCVNTTGVLKLIAPNAGTSVTIDDVSLREITEWSNAIQFDGTDDWLDVTFRDYYAAGASTFIGSWYGPVTGNSSFGLAQSSSGSTTPVYAPFGIPTTSINAAYFMRDDSASAVLNFRTYAPSALAGTDVVSAIDSGNRLVGLDHGAVSVDVAFARPGTLTSNRVTVGAIQRTSISGFAKMIVGLLCWSANVMPDSDRRAIEKFAAFLVGEHHV